jgi:hypothetical protein
MLFTFITIFTKQMKLVFSSTKASFMSSSQNSFLLSGVAPAHIGTQTRWPLQMGLMGCSETSVNYQHTLLNIPEK